MLEIITHCQSLGFFYYTKEGKLYTSFSTERDENTTLEQQVSLVGKKQKLIDHILPSRYSHVLSYLFLSLPVKLGDIIINLTLLRRKRDIQYPT